MNYVLDTNVVLFYLKENFSRKYIEKTFAPLAESNTAIISIVTVAEIRVLGRRNNWGERRMQAVDRLLNRLLVVGITSKDLIDAYVAIESFGYNKHPGKRYKGSAKNMGKNDIWIAATAFVTGSELITSDKDFSHLDEEFFKVNLIIPPSK